MALYYLDNKMFKTLKVRLYPTVKQKQMLEDHFNSYRYIYNLCLEYKTTMWKHYKINKGANDLQNELVDIRNTTPWLKKCKAECVRAAAVEVENNHKRFTKGAGYPKYKNKKSKQYFYAFQSIHFKTNKLSFFGHKIRARSSNSHFNILSTSNIKRIIFFKDKCQFYYASCLIEINKNTSSEVTTNGIIGIDLGLKDLIVTSEGKIFPNNRYLQSHQALITRYQRKFSKTKNGSANRKKLCIKIAKLHAKARNQRTHFYHQVTNELIRENQTIVMENLKIKNLVLGHNLSRSIIDASWGLLINQLEYKAKWEGKEILKVDTFFPSSKICSQCGNTKEMPLHMRLYECDCGLSLDRDINAAINIRNSGLKIPGVSMEGVGYEPCEVESKRLIINN